MICKTCGHSNAEDVRFCVACGTPMQPAAPVVRRAAASRRPRPKATPAKNIMLRRMLPVAGFGVIVAVGLILLFSSLSGPKPLAKKALKRAINGKIVSYVKLFHDDYLEQNDLLAQIEGSDEDWEVSVDRFEEEEDAKLRLSSDIKATAPIKGNELRDMQTDYLDTYGLKIKKAKRYKMEVSAKWGDEEESYDAEVIVVKIGGGWYLYSCDNPIVELLHPYTD